VPADWQPERSWGIRGLLRRVGTAILTPLRFSWGSGHFRSSLEMLAVTRRGAPLPWYTYPCIAFLRQRDYAARAVLEFGAGQSTLWWAQRARHVVAFEGDPDWLARLQPRLPAHAAIHPAPADDAVACVRQVERVLRDGGSARFDVVVIDGLWRAELVGVAIGAVSADGVIVCDDAAGYGFQQAFQGRGFSRADFFGYAPGVLRPRCTSIFFRPGAFLFDDRNPIPEVNDALAG
jgi:hypothetical protein